MNFRVLKPLSMLLSLLAAHLTTAAEPLQIIWTDVEGGGGTLVVTPAKESILIDSGWGKEESVAHIFRAATNAGVKKIDFLITTHFHLDHFGGAVELAKLMPIGTVLDNGKPEPGDDQLSNAGHAYLEFKADQRRIIQVGAEIPLKQQPGTARLSLRCMGARKSFFHPNGAKVPMNRLCDEAKPIDKDVTDNANSTVLLLQFGQFKFFDGGDLTWNLEGELVCPVNSIGTVDIYQTDHHGQANSNNPLLLGILAPTVSVMNNGARKGGDKESVIRLRAVPSIKAMYQVHRCLRDGSENTADEFIANQEEACAGHFIQCSVDPSGKNYTMSIPSAGHKKTFQTKQ
jgi:beta-lactamase superfamily II metal-dependent hydrolase